MNPSDALVLALLCAGFLCGWTFRGVWETTWEQWRINRRLRAKAAQRLCERCGQPWLGHTTVRQYVFCADTFLATSPEPFETQDATDDGCRHAG
jgi:hypothetical protein